MTTITPIRTIVNVHPELFEARPQLPREDERFPTSDIGRYTGEYDNEAQELRLTWSGAQTFLSLEECHGLLNLLQVVLFEQ